MKKHFAFILAAAALFLSSLAVYAADTVTVEIDGRQLQTDTPAQIIDGRTMVPMRAIFEALGAGISWDAETKTVTAVNDAHNISLEVGAYYLVKDGQKIELSVPAQIIDGRTLVPARAVAESFDCSVLWESEAKNVKIVTETDDRDYDIEVPAWAKELAAGVTRPAPASSKTVADKDLYVVNAFTKEEFVGMWMPIAIYSDTVDPYKFTNKAELKTELEELWLGAFLGGNEYIDYSKKYDEQEITKLVEEHTDTFLDAGLKFDDNIDFNFIRKSEDEYSLVLAVADNNDGLAPVFAAALKDREKGIRYYYLDWVDDGVYFIFGVTEEGEHLIYEMGIASDDGDFEDSLTNPETFLALVDKIEKENIPYTNITEQFDSLFGELEDKLGENADLSNIKEGYMLT